MVPENVRARGLLAADYAQLGRGHDATRQVEMAAALHPSDSTVLYNAACTYGVPGKKAEAVGMLRGAKAAGYSNEDWIHHDLDLACVHDDAEFLSMYPPPAKK
jgi:Flp pilus assembly protein TadD